MFKYNKLRYWLGLPCVVRVGGEGLPSVLELIQDSTYLTLSITGGVEPSEESTVGGSTHQKKLTPIIRAW